MLSQSRFAVIILYLLVGAALFIVSFVYYEHSRHAWLQDVQAGQRQTQAAGSSRPIDRISSSGQVRARARMRELQAALHRTNQLLETRTTVLNQKVAECRALQRELDESIAFVFSFLGVDGESADALPASLSKVKEDLEVELRSLKTRLAGSEALQQQQSAQLARLQVELESADMELAEIQMAAEEELVLMQRHRGEVETAARATIARFGTVAVPALIPLLSDERAHVRAWSAAALGDLGADAEEAMPALMELLTDPDSAVSASARTALARIEP